MLKTNLNRSLATIVAVLAGSVGCVKKDTHKDEDYFQPLYTATNIEYQRDSLNDKWYDYWQTPNETRRLVTGDCEDKSILLLDEWKRRGIKGKLIIGLRSKNDKPYHAWCEVKYKGEWHIADPVSGMFLPKKEFGVERYVRTSRGNAYCRQQKRKLGRRIKREYR